MWGESIARSFLVFASLSHGAMRSQMSASVWMLPDGGGTDHHTHSESLTAAAAVFTDSGWNEPGMNAGAIIDQGAPRKRRFLAVQN